MEREGCLSTTPLGPSGLALEPRIRKRRTTPAAPVHSRSWSPAKMAKNRQLLGTLTKVGHQPQMELFPIKDVEVDGIAMGVLSDGTPYLHIRGLARLCGVDHAALVRLIANWEDEKRRPRGAKIVEFLAAQGHDGRALSLENAGEGSHLYPDAVCMAFLEYYAYEATQGSNEIALRNYRLLARKSFRTFIYQQCGYDPNKHIPHSWRNFHDRLLLNDQIPVGYFSVFREMADIVVHLIKSGCEFDSHTVPDISVGKIWSDHWVESDYSGVYGPRRKFPHVYPDYFPQAQAGPIPAWIYPVHALGSFQTWLHTVYIPSKFPVYVANKVKAGTFLPHRATKLLGAVVRQPSLPPPPPEPPKRKAK